MACVEVDTFEEAIHFVNAPLGAEPFARRFRRAHPDGRTKRLVFFEQNTGWMQVIEVLKLEGREVR